MKECFKLVVVNQKLTIMEAEENDKKEWLKPQMTDLDFEKTFTGTMPCATESEPTYYS